MRGCKEAEALKFPAARVKKMMLADDDVRRAPLRRRSRACSLSPPLPHCHAAYAVSEARKMRAAHRRAPQVLLCFCPASASTRRLWRARTPHAALSRAVSLP